MWGNTLGWIISAVLACVLSATLAWLVQISQLSAPTSLGKDPANFAEINLPISPDTAWPLASVEEDAGPAYRQVIATWDDAARRDAQALIQHPELPLPPALNLLVQMKRDKQMALFTQQLGELINYDSDHPSLDALFEAGESACRAGLAAHQKAQGQRSADLLEAAFSLGRHLYEERVVFDEYQKGITLMADSSSTMEATLVKGSMRYDALADFNRARLEYNQSRVDPIWNMINSATDQTTDRTAGDVAAFATQSSERMWRVEATLKLGRYRYNAGSLGDQSGAIRLARKLQNDPNPAVAFAAKTAMEMTVETYRMIH